MDLFIIKKRTMNNKTKLSKLVMLIAVLMLIASLASCNPSGTNKPATVVTAGATQNVNPTYTPGPSPTPAHCLVGIWEVKDRKSYLFASVPVGAFEPTDLKYMGTVGSVGMRFYNDGIIAVQAENFMGRFDVKVGGEIQILDITINGFANGQYKLDGDRLTILGVKRDEMTYKATFNDEVMMSEKQAKKFLPLFLEPYTQADVSCNLETLTLNLINFPGASSPLEFKRLR